MDNLIVAYLAIGANEALREVKHPDLGKFSGQLGFIDRITEAEPLLTHVHNWLEANDLIDGVYLYDVVKSFGLQLARLLLVDNFHSHERLLSELLMTQGYDQSDIDEAIESYSVLSNTFVQIQGCIECDGTVIAGQRENEAEYFGLYMGEPGAYRWFADCETYELARQFANMLTSEHGYKIDDRVKM